jgi:polar amino acid transport system substrate-binding protein
MSAFIRRKWRALACFAVASSLLTACGGATAHVSQTSGAKYHLVSPGQLIVATYSSGPPVLYPEPGGKLAGVDGDFLTRFAADQHLRLVPYETTFASVILAVEEGKADVGTYYYYTPTRAQHVYYTYPFMAETASLYTLKGFPYSGPASLMGKKVATVIGFVWAPYLQKVFGSNAVLYPDAAAAETALLSGQVQGYVNSEVAIDDPVLSKARNVEIHTLKAGDFGFPQSVIATEDYNFVRCDNKGLAEAMDAELSKLVHSGGWGKILKANKIGAAGRAPLKSPPELCG